MIPTMYTPKSTMVVRMDVEADSLPLLDSLLLRYEDSRWAKKKVTVIITRLW